HPPLARTPSLKTIAHIITRYTAFLGAVLKPLGAWGVLAIAGIDSSLFGMPLDLVVAGYISPIPPNFLLTAGRGRVGPWLGSWVITASATAAARPYCGSGCRRSA